ncbi:FUSC family protein [Orrella sp. 11846]|uniref:FUSC family protein n=1 Tax=Orrella sp. 11846 TaxID=3409913 RepID=UPI003B5932F5
MTNSSNVTGLTLHNLLQLKPATWNWGRCLRAAFCVGVPFLIGVAVDDIMSWMWIAMGTLMMTTGERGAVAYGPRALGLLGTALLGAAGYLFGYLSLVPFGYTIVVMAVVGFLAGKLSQRGPNWSIGFLQLLLTASIAIGVPSIGTFWWSSVLYLVGAVLYVMVLGIEALLVRSVPASSVTPNTPHKTPSVTNTVGAIILSVSLTIAYASHFVISASHWFWIPLTVGLIVKPDLGNIFERSVLRAIGTVFGVLIATALLMVFSKGGWLAFSLALLAGVLPWCMARSYALQAIVLTPLVLLLVDMIMPGAHNINYGLQRLIDTVIGGVIVILTGYLTLSASKFLTKDSKNI